MKLIAIDPGAKPYLTVIEVEPQSLVPKVVESVQLKSKINQSIEDRTFNLFLQLETVFEDHKPDAVIIEDVLPGATRLKSKDAVYWLVVCSGLTYSLSSQYGASLHTLVPTSLKKWATGSGIAKKPDMVIAANKRWGSVRPDIKPSQHNQADSELLASYYLEELLLK